MRTSILFTAAFAATVLATPLGKRDVEVETVVDTVFVTDVVTETAGAVPATTSAVVEAAATSVTAVAHFGHHTWHPKASSSLPAPSSSSEVEPSSTYVAPSSSSEVEPSSTYVAPTTSAAPVTTEAPSSLSSSSIASQATSTVAASGSTASTYQQAVVNHHNYHRSNHSAPAIVWNQTLANIAQEIAQSCYYAHNVTAGGGGYGQNIAAGVPSGQVAKVITDLFYNGEVNAYSGLYGQASPDMSNFENWGHFSQIVWKTTTAVGCYTTSCYDGTTSTLGNVGGPSSGIGGYFTVCNYYPPGNYAGEYTNVGASLKKATVQGTYNVASSLSSQSNSQ